MLVALGAQLTRADDIAHELMQPGNAVYREVVRHFGPDILNSDGTVNRPKLAGLTFGDGQSSRVKELNQLVHPAVVQRQSEWMNEVGRRDSAAVAVVEAALILEAGAASQFDRLIVVTCRPEQRAQRLAQRLNIDFDTARMEVTRRMAAQLSDEEKIKAADYVIDNSGTVEQMREQVARIYPELKQAASGEAFPPGLRQIRREN